jgi:hypothetical protein
MTHKQTGMRTVNQLIDFMLDMPDDTTSVLLDSNKFKLEIPICEKDVMCMKVIRFIEEEYVDHTMGETIEMLQDTIWWITTFLVAFDNKEHVSAEN